MSPSESLPLALNEVSDSDIALIPAEPECVMGCHFNDVAKEVLPYNVTVPNISIAREVRAYEHNRRQAKKAIKLEKSRQRKQAVRPQVRFVSGPGLNRRVRKETGAPGVKRVRNRSVANFLLEDGVGVFEDEYFPMDDMSVEEEGSMYGTNWTALHGLSCDFGSPDDIPAHGRFTPSEFGSSCDSGSDDTSEHDSQLTPFEFGSELEDQFRSPYDSWSPSSRGYCQTASIYDDCTNGLGINVIIGYRDRMTRNLDSASSKPVHSGDSKNEDECENKENLLLPQLNFSLPNISLTREVRACEYVRDQVKSKAEFGKLRERKQLGRLTKRDKPRSKGRKQGRPRVVDLDTDTLEDVDEESTIPIEISLSSILSEEPSSRPFDMSDLVPTIKVKKESEPGFEFVPRVRAVIALDDPVRELDFEDSQWEHVWNDDLLNEPLSYVHAASF